MPRNGSGTYTVPNTMVSGTTATAADVNGNFSDIATAMSASLPLNGEAAMTGQLPAFSGTLSLPGYTFSGDTNTGIYRPGADAFSLVCGGVSIIDLTTTAATINKNITAASATLTQDFKNTGLGSVPVGTVVDYAGTSAPSGWLFCYGQAVSRTTYSALFTALSTTYGTGDGSTTFNLPDLRGRVGAGKDDMGGASAGRLSSPNGSNLGAAGGANTITIAQANLPNVNLSSASLTVASITPSHTVTAYQNTNTISPGGATDVPVISGGATVTFTGTIGGSVPLGGSGTAINVAQPTLVLNKIIYTGVA